MKFLINVAKNEQFHRGSTGSICIEQSQCKKNMQIVNAHVIMVEWFTPAKHGRLFERRFNQSCSECIYESFSSCNTRREFHYGEGQCLPFDPRS
jgi:hypothetical protein